MNQNQFLIKVQNRESFLLANDGQYLGRLTLNSYATESISNPYGVHGSLYSSTSIKNHYSNYGSPYSSLSPFNPYTSTPPIIYLRGTFYGYLTKNGYMSINSVDPENLTVWMRQNNLNY